MSFDRSNADDLLALKNEVNNDPLGMGYGAVIGDTQAVLDLLNLTANNLSPATGSAPLTARKLLDIIFSETIGSPVEYKLQLIFEATDSLDSDVSEFKTRIADLDAGLGVKIGLVIRDLSRAEILFAVDDANGVKEFVNISREDWLAARDS